MKNHHVLFELFLLLHSHRHRVLVEGKADGLRSTSSTTPPVFGPDFHPTQEDNMNGLYPLTPTPGAAKPNSSKKSFPKQYKDYPGGVESFDVYSPPITTLYSQVWWKSLPPVDLPQDIVEKYKGKGMAIVGWEIDQVRKTPEGDKSVPISASYNHHYVSSMIGADAKYRKVKLTGPDDPLVEKLVQQNGGGCGGGGSHNLNLDQEHYLIEGPEASPLSGHKTHIAMSSGNGGEYRKTFHGFAPEHAFVIDSPTQMQVMPMQIDTWNRDEMDIDGPFPPKFVPGPLPRASLAPKVGALHSGLLECPMTTRLTKVVTSTNYTFLDNENAKCEEPIQSFYECYEAAATLLRTQDKAVLHNQTGSNPSLPKGCSVSTTKDGNGVRHQVFFNELDKDSQSPSCSTENRCVCPTESTPFGKAKGALLYHPTNQSVDVGEGMAAGFNDKCRNNPLLEEMRNPTCDIRHYQGGQWACKHMWSLLDADQEIPWVDQPLVFHHKYRFYVQPYAETFHQQVHLGESWASLLLVGSPWEYDIPKCSANVPGCSLEKVGGGEKVAVEAEAEATTWVHTIRKSMYARDTYVTLNNHCHAPTCLSVSVYACPKGTPLEDCNATSGKLICETKPIYGGTGHPALVGTRFDEPGYIAVPDCVWGPLDYGLELPLDLDGVPVHVVKKANATDGHYGEMGGGQPWVILDKKKKKNAESAPAVEEDARMVA